MHLIIASVVNSEATPVYPDKLGEIFGTATINIAEARTVAQSLQAYCAQRCSRQVDSFPLHAIKLASDEAPGMVRFGVAVGVEESLLSTNEFDALREEVDHLAQRLANNGNQRSLAFNRSRDDAAAVERIDRIQDGVVAKLRDAHGGERLPRSLDIRTDNHVVAQLSNVLLAAPDRPAKDMPSEIEGRINSVEFSPRRCTIRPQLGAESVSAFVTSDELFSEVIAAGMARKAVRCALRVCDDGRGRMAAQLRTITEPNAGGLFAAD